MRLLIALVLALTQIHCFAQDIIKIYFDLGIPTLNKSAKQQLDSLAYYDILLPNKNYGIIGYADYLGSEESNVTLSQNRANAVQEYLQGLGIKQENIETVTGKGEINRDLASADGYPQDRRVDIVLGGFKETAQLPSPQQQRPVQPLPPNQPVAALHRQKIDISKLQTGDVFDLENIFFKSGSTVMIEHSLPALEALLEMMEQNAQVKIRIEGHVHCYSYNTNYTEHFVSPTGDKTIEGISKAPKAASVVDTATHNETTHKWQNIAAKELSMARARVVRDYLVEHGIDSGRLQYAGLGCKGMSEHKDNRRVAVRILEK